jgi:peptide/nickel transport system ATP-binding protein
MYAGRVVEKAPVLELFKSPRHPYSQGLLASVPHGQVGVAAPAAVGPQRLKAIPGTVVAAQEAQACRFANRCALRLRSLAEHPLCSQTEPPLYEIEPLHSARCHYLPETALEVAQ